MQHNTTKLGIKKTNIVTSVAINTISLDPSLTVSPLFPQSHSHSFSALSHGFISSNPPPPTPLSSVPFSPFLAVAPNLISQNQRNGPLAALFSPLQGLTAKTTMMLFCFAYCVSPMHSCRWGFVFLPSYMHRIIGFLLYRPFSSKFGLLSKRIDCRLVTDDLIVSS